MSKPGDLTTIEKTMLHKLHNISVSFLFLLMLAGAASAGEKQLLIAVAGESPEPTSQISKVAARAPYFLLFDGQSKLLQTLKNPNTSATGGAGPSTADFLAKHKATLVIAGQFGRKMENALHSSKIQTVERQGRILDAVKEQNHAQ